MVASTCSSFLAIKAVEYYIDYEATLVPRLAFEPQEWRELDLDPGHVQLFLVLYYIMTGVHALHLIIGIGLLKVMILLAWLGRITPRTYWTVFAALIALTLLTVGLSFVELGVWHSIVGLAIATAKALLVALFFMHVLYSSRLTWIMVGAGAFWLGIRLVLTLTDYLTRPWLWRETRQARQGQCLPRSGRTCVGWFA